MSGRSYNYYMRPQDHDGNNHHAVGRGRSPHQASSRGRSRDRSYDFHERRSHRYDERDMRDGTRGDYYHRSRGIDQSASSHSHRSRSRSCDPPLSKHASSSRDHYYQRNSSHSRKRSRSPDQHHRNLSNSDSYECDQSHRSKILGQPKDSRSCESHPFASTNTNMERRRRIELFLLLGQMNFNGN